MSAPKYQTTGRFNRSKKSGLHGLRVNNGGSGAQSSARCNRPSCLDYLFRCGAPKPMPCMASSRPALPAGSSGKHSRSMGALRYVGPPHPAFPFRIFHPIPRPTFSSVSVQCDGIPAQLFNQGRSTPNRCANPHHHRARPIQGLQTEEAVFSAGLLEACLLGFSRPRGSPTAEEVDHNRISSSFMIGFHRFAVFFSSAFQSLDTWVWCHSATWKSQHVK